MIAIEIIILCLLVIVFLIFLAIADADQSFGSVLLLPIVCVLFATGGVYIHEKFQEHKVSTQIKRQERLACTLGLEKMEKEQDLWVMRIKEVLKRIQDQKNLAKIQGTTHTLSLNGEYEDLRIAEERFDKITREKAKTLRIGFLLGTRYYDPLIL